MPVCDGCDENVARLDAFQQGRRVVRLCPMCVSERELQDEVLKPASRAWTPEDLEGAGSRRPSWLMPAVAVVLLVAFVLFWVLG